MNFDFLTGLNYKEELFSMEFFSSFFNDFIGNAVLCVACVLMLSYLREVPPKFDGKRMVSAGLVLSLGAFVSRFNAHMFSPDAMNNEPPVIQQALSHFVYNMRYSELSDKEKLSLFIEITSSIIGIVSICAGAFILMRLFKAKHIVPMVVVQTTGFLIKELMKTPYENLIKYAIQKIDPDVFEKLNSLNRFLYGYNGFCYGCFMIIMIILYIFITRHIYEAFWTKKINTVKHFISLIVLFAVYTTFIIIGDIIIGKYGIENTADSEIKEKIIFELFINVFLAAALLVVPRRTYSITRAELQNDFYEVKREETVELYEYSQAQSKAIRKYIHDLPKHFRSIDEMAIKINADEISEYVHELDEELIKAKCEFSTGNVHLDDLLVTELKIAKKYETNIIFTGMFPNEGIKRKDLTTVFMNLIENAIEACKKVSEKREITIDSTIANNRVFVSISNPFEHTIQKSNGIFNTTKRNNGFHGFGLSNVKNVVEKKEYDGYFSTEDENNIFTASFNLKFKQ